MFDGLEKEAIEKKNIELEKKLVGLRGAKVYLIGRKDMKERRDRGIRKNPEPKGMNLQREVGGMVGENFAKEVDGEKGRTSKKSLRGKRDASRKGKITAHQRGKHTRGEERGRSNGSCRPWKKGQTKAGEVPSPNFRLQQRPKRTRRARAHRSK